MESFVVAFGVVFPLFLEIGLGILFRQIKLMTKETAREINAISFRVFLPILLFSDMYHMSVDTTVNLRLIFFAALIVVIPYVMAFFCTSGCIG